MALSTYANLTSAIQNWLHRSDLSSYVDDFVTLGESRIYNDLRIREMETVTTSTVSSGVIAVPSNYIEMKSAYVSSVNPNVKLERKTAEWIYEYYPDRTATDIPLFFAREGSNFIFGPYSDGAYAVTMNYYNKLAALSSAVNTVFTTYPGLWLFASLSETAPFLKDDKRIIIWEAKYQDLLKRIQKESDDEEWSGSNLRITSDIQMSRIHQIKLS